jgi:hypothetical protein
MQGMCVGAEEGRLVRKEWELTSMLVIERMYEFP